MSLTLDQLSELVEALQAKVDELETKIKQSLQYINDLEILEAERKEEYQKNISNLEAQLRQSITTKNLVVESNAEIAGRNVDQKLISLDTTLAQSKEKLDSYLTQSKEKLDSYLTQSKEKLDSYLTQSKAKLDFLDTAFNKHEKKLDTFNNFIKTSSKEVSIVSNENNKTFKLVVQGDLLVIGNISYHGNINSITESNVATSGNKVPGKNKK
ncbi:hypothetical protein NIES2109_61080 (plasmid) [Nostoc sp. HK-01]|nr:hypothetical protein NIES2109_61080 [Nostoc sp. HK-01]